MTDVLVYIWCAMAGYQLGIMAGYRMGQGSLRDKATSRQLSLLAVMVIVFLLWGASL